MVDSKENYKFDLRVKTYQRFLSLFAEQFLPDKI